MAKADIKCFFEKDTNTCQYLVVCPNTKNSAIIDPVLSYDPVSGTTSHEQLDKIVQEIRDRGLTVQWLLETHAHADHLSGQAHLRHLFPQANTAIGKEIHSVQSTFKELYNMDDLVADGSQFKHLFGDGEVFHIGDLKVTVIHTPGHTKACVCYYIEDDAVFTGDTIFMPDMGTARCDFPGGSAETLYDSVQKILQLPDHVRLFVGHDYAPNGRELAWETTVGEEKKTNKHVKEGTTKEEFVKMRKERDATLTLPRLIHPSVQFNIRAGKPPKGEKGKYFVRTPLTLPDHLKEE